MSAIIALFDDDQALTKALDRMAKEGYKENVEVVTPPVRGGGAGTGAAVASPVGTTGSQAGGAVVNVGDYPSALRHANLDDEEKAFYWRSVSEGAEMVTIDVDDDRQGKVLELLKELGATRVHTND